jgi:hypothetical protein
MTETKKVFSVSKQQLRQLLGSKELPMPPTSFRNYWRRYQLPEALGMTAAIFARTKIFYGTDFEKLKTVIGFDDSDLFDL